MKLLDYLNQRVGLRTELAAQLGISAPYLSQMLSGERSISVGRCVQIERATRGAVTRMDLRPADWWVVWPELAALYPERAEADRRAIAPEPAEPRGASLR